MLLGTVRDSPTEALSVPARARRRFRCGIGDALFARVGRGENAIINALYSVIGHVFSDRLHPVYDAFDKGDLRLQASVSVALVGLVITFLLVASTEFLHRNALESCQVDRESLADGHATNIIEGSRRHAGDRSAGDRSRRRILSRTPRRSLPASRRRDGSALDDGPMIVAFDAYGPHRQRGRIAEMANLPEGVRAITIRSTPYATQRRP